MEWRKLYTEHCNLSTCWFFVCSPGGASAVDGAPIAIMPDLLLLCSNGRVRFSLQESLDTQNSSNFVAPEYPSDFPLSDEALEKVNIQMYPAGICHAIVSHSMDI